MNTDSTTEGPNQTTWDAELRVTPQFDAGRWKLRLERIPISVPQQFHRRSVSNIAVGFTMVSPVLCLIGAYLLAWLAIFRP
jgi:hypothetical protein